MSKKKKDINFKIVEFVDNLIITFSWISDSISFWNLDKIYPTNLIKKVCDDYYKELKNFILALK